MLLRNLELRLFVNRHRADAKSVHSVGQLVHLPLHEVDHGERDHDHVRRGGSLGAAPRLLGLLLRLALLHLFVVNYNDSGFAAKEVS